VAAGEARIDYRLQRRIALDQLALGKLALEQPCDAHPELLRAARHLGEPKGEQCPVCHVVELVTLHYAFLHDGPRTQGGRVVEPSRLAAYAQRKGDMTVYEVEVCQGCRWNHLVSQRVVRAARPDPSAGGAGTTAQAARG
jgi:hypothetical protein